MLKFGYLAATEFRAAVKDASTHLLDAVAGVLTRILLEVKGL